MHHFTLLVRYLPPLMSAIDNGDDGHHYYSITHMLIFHICKPDIEIFGSDFLGLPYHSSLLSATVADTRAFRFCLKLFKEKCIEVKFKDFYVTTDPHTDVFSTSISSRYTSISIDISSRCSCILILISFGLSFLLLLNYFDFLLSRSSLFSFDHLLFEIPTTLH